MTWLAEARKSSTPVAKFLIRNCNIDLSERNARHHPLARKAMSGRALNLESHKQRSHVVRPDWCI